MSGQRDGAREELQRYLSAVSCGILQYTRDTRQVVYANDIALEILGYSSREEIMADGFNGVVGTVHPEDAAEINRLVAGLTGEGDRAEYEYRVTTRDGKKRRCYGTACLFHRGEEEPLIQRSIIDITEAHDRSRRETESMLRAVQLALGATGDVIFIFDCRKRTSLLTVEDAKSLGVERLLTDVPYGVAGNGTVAEESVGEFIRLHEEIMAGAGEAKGYVELRGLYGRSGYYELTLRALPDGEGRPTGRAVGVYHDISAVARLSREQARIIETLSSTYSSVYVLHIPTLTYRRTAERESRILAFPDEGDWQENFRTYVDRFVAPEYRGEFEGFLDRDWLVSRLADGKRITVEYCREIGGWKRATLFPTEYDGEGRAETAIFAVQQIEEEKQRELETQRALQQAYEAARLASDAKTTFLSNMSHDIRTPMNAIIGMTAIASAHLHEPEKLADCLKKINSSGRHLLGLINQVLDMSKIESGKVDLSEEEFNLSDLMDEIIAMNLPAGRARGHELTVRTSGITHENVIGDRTRLEQVFNNLLSNAVKYTPDGGRIEIAISEKETNKPNIGWYEVIIRDNGIGMTEEFRQNIFEPFTRASDTRAAAMQGTGLGMPIARNIVRMMNGDIRVESELNRGSTFTVSFALRLQADRQEEFENLRDLSVLVVDDNEFFCESACLLLDSLSMRSEYATSGQEAVEKAVERHDRGEDYYAIIMDWKMPGMDGVEATEEIRRRVGRTVPVIVLTSYDWSEIEGRARAAGVSAFMSKPLFKTKVIELFNELGAGRPREQAILPVTREEHDFSGKRILLAEDNELNREIATELLSMTGVELETAENGALCVDRFLAGAPGYYDLIFMDIQMPVMNGYDAARAIRASGHPDGERIPIIAMTANAFSTDVRAAFEAGMNGHIAKPIDMGAVIRTMAEHMGG